MRPTSAPPVASALARSMAHALLALAGLLIVTLPVKPARSADAAITDGPAGPVIVFLGQRFAVAAGPQGFDSGAFDATNSRFASQGAIRDLCGGFVSAGPNEQPGLAWDPLTGTYWQVTGDRVVRRWSGAAVLDTVFTVPLTFNVPGSGPDTLEAVRGIAVDPTSVYLVDAGPAQGEITSNAWFKFTRSGTPVKCSKSTDVLQHLELDPDALFDDIVYVPTTSPIAPGLLLIALEHSGIQVVDTEGFFVAKFRWSTQNLPPGVKLAAFAGLAIDPASGNLYLVDNDRGRAQVWVRLAPTDAGFLVGTGSIQAYLQRPIPGCNLPLWKDLSPGVGSDPSGIFGIAYRDVDARVYGFDFTAADFWAFSPLSGEATRIGTGGPPSIWGLAYDTQRDVFYAGEETATDILVHVVDPTDGSTTALPLHTGFYFNDLAFDPLNGGIYAVSLDTPMPMLIRINRDTGAAVTVGPSVATRGLTWDPSSGRLIGVTNGPCMLHSIDPATGSSTVIGSLPNNSGWEGLAFVKLPANPVGVGILGPGYGADARVHPFPNPATGPTALRFTLARPTTGAVRIFDVTGRLIRELRPGALPAGEHTLLWDGRDESDQRVATGVYLVRVDGAAGASGKVLQIRR